MTLPQNNPRQRINHVIWFGGWGAVSAVGVLLKADPHGHGTHQKLGLPPCPSVLLFDRPCPGCGLTTSWTALLHGDFALAFHAHPLGPFLYLAYMLSAFWALTLAVRNLRMNPYDTRFDKVVLAGGIAFFAFGMGRAVLTPHYRTDREAMMVGIVRSR